MERIEITVHANQADEIEKILEEFKVPYINTAAESYKVQCIFYVITAPQEIASMLLSTLAQKFDSRDRVNTITHYKTESTVSEYLCKFEVYLRGEEEDYGRGYASSGKEIADARDKMLSDFKSVKDRITINKKNSSGSAEGLLSKTDSFLSRKKEIYVMILVATIVALVGLVTNNVAVIIGAMLISPLLGPISSIAANLVLGRQSNAKESVLFTSKLILSSIGLAALLTAGLSFSINWISHKKFNLGPIQILSSLLLQ